MSKLPHFKQLIPKIIRFFFINKNIVKVKKDERISISSINLERNCVILLKINIKKEVFTLLISTLSLKQYFVV